MTITCCHNCENRHEKCHAHCEEYITQKILKIMVEAQEIKEREIRAGLQNEKERRIAKQQHINRIRRRR
jgi:hypothetical protein